MDTNLLGRGFVSEVIFEDGEMVVAGKEAGVEVPVLGEVLGRRFGELMVVHRVDVEMSGVVVFARNRKARDFLTGQFQSGTVGRVEMALCAGVAPAEDEFVVEKNLIADASRPGCVVVMKRKGAECVTRVRVMERFAGWCWLEVVPVEGRWHQARAHLASVGLPVVGDAIYGSGEGVLLSRLKRGYKTKEAVEKPLIGQLGLHGARLRVRHPMTKEAVEFAVEAPKEFGVALKQLRKFAGR